MANPQSKIFYSEEHKSVARAATRLLNAQPDYLSAQTVLSTRAVGDAIQSILSTNFRDLLGDSCASYTADFPRRAMADFAFRDTDDFHYVVDVKTHRSSTKFNMPNLVSVERLARFYEDDKNYFALVLVRYEVEGIKVTVEETHFIPIEFLDWECLTIGALGWGQLQIRNSNRIMIVEGQTRREWMLHLCDVMTAFYPKEIEKIESRKGYFARVRERWENHP